MIYKCQYCGKEFRSEKECWKHELDCSEQDVLVLEFTLQNEVKVNFSVSNDYLPPQKDEIKENFYQYEDGGVSFLVYCRCPKKEDLPECKKKLAEAMKHHFQKIWDQLTNPEEIDDHRTKWFFEN